MTFAGESLPKSNSASTRFGRGDTSVASAAAALAANAAVPDVASNTTIRPNLPTTACLMGPAQYVNGFEAVSRARCKENP